MKTIEIITIWILGGIALISVSTLIIMLIIHIRMKKEEAKNAFKTLLVAEWGDEMWNDIICMDDDMEHLRTQSLKKGQGR